MIEAASFLLGLGFSLLIYFRSIRPSKHPLPKKMLYLLFTVIGVTGTLFLAGILAAHFLRRWGTLS